MLMENRVDSDDAQNAKKPRSVDLQTLYDQNPKSLIMAEKQNQISSLKRKHGKVDIDSALDMKSKKELLLSSLPSGKKIKKSFNDVCRGDSSSASGDLNKVEYEPSQTGDTANGSDGILLNLNDIHQIPKRKRDLVRRKKAYASNRLKQEGTLGGNGSSSDMEPNLIGSSKGNIGQDGEKKGQPVQNGNFLGSFGIQVDKNAKRKKGFNDHKDISSSKIASHRLSEKESIISHVPSDGPSSNKKAKSSRSTRKKTRLKIDADASDANPMSDRFTRAPKNLLEDDEEKLEENAAMMLSSRFDPSCMGLSSNSKCSDSPPLGRGDASHVSNLKSNSDAASGDADARVLRPRDQCDRKGHLRKRRHFYEVLAKDVDAVWMVKKKIKVYWPLDQIWYFGEVIGFDSKKLLHHIKYDDREEEWIDLQNERFKLLLFPSELPCKGGRRRSRAAGRHHLKEDTKATLQNDYPFSSHIDSEPIISWLGRSNGRNKPSSSGITKKPKAPDQSGKNRPSSSIPDKGTAYDCLDIESSKNSADKVLSEPLLPDASYGGIVGRASHIERSREYPIVYFRRRFRRKECGKGDVSDDKLYHFTKEQLVCNRVADSVQVAKAGIFHQEYLTEIFDSSAGQLVGLELPRFGDNLVILNLNTRVVNAEAYRFKLNFIPFLVPYYSLAVENLRVFHTLLMLQHGALTTLWPRVHLEMLFVDNCVGLRFLIFEGCLMQAIAFVFFILEVFHKSNQQSSDVDLPVTSIRFRFSCLQDVMKQLVFTFYNCCQLEISRWILLDHMAEKYCFVAKQLPLSECTYNNIKALESDSIHLNTQSSSPEPSSRLGLWRKTRQPMAGACVKHDHPCVNRDGKWARLPPFALLFSAAPNFCLSLHLKLLTECSIPCAKFKDGNPVLLPENGGIELVDCCPGKNVVASVGFEDVEMIHKPSQLSQVPGDDCLNKGEGKGMKSVHHDLSSQPSRPKNNCPPLEGKTTYRPLSGITVEIPLFDSQERPNGGVHSGQSSVVPVNGTDNSTCRRRSTASRSSHHPSQAGNSLLRNLSHASSEGKPGLLCSGPKKPRTQVSYSLPLEVHDTTTKLRTHNIMGFSHKRIRRTSEKRESDVSRKYQRSLESLSCDVNLLVSMEDRGWREGGARVMLEPVDDNEWQLVVKISESIRHTYKAIQFLQSGSTNRYTHAMIWKGGKDWSLEFTDRSQWTLFKEMHEECYTRNFRAALVKNIPIPGVRLIEENDDNEVELPFIRLSTRYFKQLQTDVDIAMDPLRVIYDMDSDDESWISKIRSCSSESCGLGNISDEMFEKLMDKLEKCAYVKQQEYFTSDELEQLVAEGEPLEAIEVIYEHWLEKRQKKGMPLVRHLQPPLWKRYQKQVKEWESAVSKSNGTVSDGWQEKSILKPPIFAFCFKPRGMELPNNRGTKYRSQKKLPVAGHGYVPGDHEAFHQYGSSRSLRASTRTLSPRGFGSPRYFPVNRDVYDRRIHYPRLYRTKSRRIGAPNDQQVFPSHNQRFISKRNGSPRFCHLERAPWVGVEHLDPSDMDEFRLRDASSAAQHAVNMAKMKREHAERLLYKADLAIHKAAVALMIADSIKASREVPTNDSSSDNQ